MKKNYAVSLAKGIGIFGVVAHHLANRRFGEFERPWIGIAGGICDWAVPLFIVVAGYLHGLSELKQKRDISHFLVSRAKRLLFPYVLVSFIYAVLYCLLIRFGALSDPSVSSPKWQDFWFSSLTLNNGIGEQLYFLPLLFIVSAVAYLIILFCRSVVSRAVLMGFFIFVGLLFIPETASPIFKWSWQHFTAGVIIYIAGFQLSSGRKCEIYYFTFTSFIALFLVCFQWSEYFHFVFALTLFSGLLLVPIRVRSIEAVGDASGTIFLYHSPFFIQSLLVIAALNLNSELHILSAYLILMFTIIFFTLFYFQLKRLGLNKLAY